MTALNLIRPNAASVIHRPFNVCLVARHHSNHTITRLATTARDRYTPQIQSPSPTPRISTATANPAFARPESPPPSDSETASYKATSGEQFQGFKTTRPNECSDGSCPHTPVPGGKLICNSPPWRSV
jgi:hypothetical protein